MKTTLMKRLCLATTFSLVCAVAFAGVPPTLHYQGKVTVDGEPFHGRGLFQFALVDGGTENVRGATATALVTNGFVTSVTVVDGGSGYDAAPRVDIVGGGGGGAAAVATIEDGQVVSISVTGAGSGYSSAPGVVLEEPPPATMKTLWSHDKRGEGGQPPGTHVPVDVRNGVFSVALGGEDMEKAWYPWLRRFLSVRPSFSASGSTAGAASSS